MSLSSSRRSSAAALLVLAVCWASTAEAFQSLSPSLFGGIRVSMENMPTRAVFTSNNNPAHKLYGSSDRYSSSSIGKSLVSDHVQQLYAGGGSYRATTPRVEHEVANSSEGQESRATIPTNHELLKQLNRYPALILNADYQPMSYLPLSVCHWQEAIKSVFSGKVTVVDVYEGVTVRAANLEIPLPSVIALNDYVPLSSHRPAFTRRNVYLRDEFRCQYCYKSFHSKELSIDHVVPRSMGGQLNWENAVTCCLKCNGRKGHMLVKDLKAVGMKLRAEPRAPSRHELATKAGKILPKKVHATWQPYLSYLRVDDDNTDHDYHGLYDDHRQDDHQGGTVEAPKKRKKTSKNQKRRAKKNEQEAFVRR